MYQKADTITPVRNEPTRRSTFVVIREANPNTPNIWVRSVRMRATIRGTHKYFIMKLS
jgi:hypothetical protein